VDFSIVIPVLNEVETLMSLWQRLQTVMTSAGGDWEVIFVNDGSTDGSLNLLLRLRESHPQIKILDLARNFGHQPALTAGLDHASGRAVILMDADLQDTPETLPAFIQKWREGYQVVYAQRVNRKEGWLKSRLFDLFYQVQTRLSSIPTPLYAGIFSLLDRRVVQVLRSMPEHNRYLAGLRAYAGFRQIGVPSERGARYHGGPRVGFFSLLRLAFDAMFAFSTLPLRLVFGFGFLLAIVSFTVALIGLYYRYVLHQEYLEWAFGLTTVFLFAGIQLISLGIIGEYIGRIYEEVKRRPYYICREKYGFGPQRD
jgi:dolichol-phosphate mannosyltransferase